MIQFWNKIMAWLSDQMGKACEASCEVCYDCAAGMDTGCFDWGYGRNYPESYEEHDYCI